MALSPSDLRKVARKFGLSHDDPLMDLDFALHSTAVQLCCRDGKLSRYIDKMIDSRFARYSKRISGQKPSDLIRAVKDGGEGLKIPLWVVLWNLATRGVENCASVETALFGFLHMMEHQLVRDFWDRRWDVAEREGKEDARSDDVGNLKRRLLDLQREVDRSRRLSAALSRQVERMKAPSPQKERIGVSTEGLRSPVDKEAAEKIRRLRSLLQEARSQKGALEKECARLRTAMEVLVNEVSVCSEQCSAGNDESGANVCPAVRALKGKRIAMVGGIESLERHYRKLVEVFGGEFHRHSGECGNGQCHIDACIRNADLVVCPVDVNSHNAAKAAKRICKRYGIPCCFPRSAGLMGLRSAIEEHFGQTHVA
jgi:hypothetical protein